MARKGGKDRGICQRKGKAGWWVRIYADGRQRYVKCSSKTQAKAVYERLKVAQREGRLLPKTRPQRSLLLKEYYQKWLANQPLKGKKRSTIETYACRIRKHVLPVFGSLSLSAIDRPRIKAWASQLLQSGLDFDTVLNVLLTYSCVLTEAVEDGLIVANPALHAGKILKRPKTLEESELEIFTPEEERAFLATIKEHRPSFYPMALTFFRTGLRHGEVCGLHREDLNFRERSLHVRRNWTGGRLTTPKNGKSRTVDMSKGLMVAVKEWMVTQDLESAAVGESSPQILFPGNLGGTRQKPSYMAENWLRYKM